MVAEGALMRRRGDRSGDGTLCPLDQFSLAQSYQYSLPSADADAAEEASEQEWLSGFKSQWCNHTYKEHF
jgi:hypothetical protein